MIFHTEFLTSSSSTKISNLYTVRSKLTKGRIRLSQYIRGWYDNNTNWIRNEFFNLFLGCWFSWRNHCSQGTGLETFKAWQWRQFLCFSWFLFFASRFMAVLVVILPPSIPPFPQLHQDFRASMSPSGNVTMNSKTFSWSPKGAQSMLDELKVWRTRKMFIAKLFRY